jgi:uncharacterized short protein YbdD (DUF466 family)
VSARASIARAAAALRRAVRALHVVVGAPDYERYVEHHRRHHAGPPLGRAEFERRYMERRAEPGSRCC